MKLDTINQAAILRETGVYLTDGQSALDLIATVRYASDCTAMVLPMEAVAADFWRLSTGLAGDILQKFTTYQMRLALVGDFSRLAAGSKPLHDFIYESNQGRNIVFAATEAEALERLA